jgi:hypothetical protein
MPGLRRDRGANGQRDAKQAHFRHSVRLVTPMFIASV